MKKNYRVVLYRHSGLKTKYFEFSHEARSFASTAIIDETVYRIEVSDLTGKIKDLN